MSPTLLNVFVAARFEVVVAHCFGDNVITQNLMHLAGTMRERAGTQLEHVWRRYR